MTDRSDPPARPAERVAIVGGGFSGAMQAINLLRHDGPDAVLIERRPVAGRGTAYSATLDDHLLNVRAANMSAFPDAPDHFARWLMRQGLGAGGDFVARRTYGRYLAELLDEAVERSRGRLCVVRDTALDIEPRGRGVRIALAAGEPIDADAAILAVGNLPPHTPPGLDAAALGPDRYAADPWADDAADGLTAEDMVLIIGTGLTMVDAALLLESRGFKGRIVALSRRGLLPRAHVADAGTVPGLSERPALSPARLLRCVRDHAGAIGWRGAVDALRPYTQSMWLAASEAERGRFLRHLRPWWDVHRHRLAPRVAERIEAMRARGQLEIVGGRIVGAPAEGAGARLEWRPRGADKVETIAVRRIINCTGPQGDLLRTDEPLLRRLLERGMIRPDAHRLGIEVNRQAETIAADGSAQPNLLAIGPMTRGAFWEIIAVPDIRVQSWAVARKLANAHWVEGEGL
jgi:uncharacterized NAD(P)/FAD-binding protein YdhS